MNSQMWLLFTIFTMFQEGKHFFSEFKIGKTKWSLSSCHSHNIKIHFFFLVKDEMIFTYS